MIGSVLFIILLQFSHFVVYPGTMVWGFHIHRQINRTAVFTLPSGMIRFYKNNLNELMRTAVDPDRRRYVNPAEPPRHYIDLDLYDLPDSLDLTYHQATERFGEEFMLENGIVPWHVNRLYYALITAFRLRDAASIIRISSDIGHYVGDAHVPLHTTSNYDGERTNQEGIHALWETRLPELFFDEYDLFTGRAEYLENPLKDIMGVVRSSHLLVDSVLETERLVHNESGEDKARGFGLRGQKFQRTFTRKFSRKYHNRLNGMVERQFRKSVKMTGDLWYTCWVVAGQPDLDSLSLNGIAREKWVEKYDSLRRVDSIMFSNDYHLEQTKIIDQIPD